MCIVGKFEGICNTFVVSDNSVEGIAVVVVVECVGQRAQIHQATQGIPFSD